MVAQRILPIEVLLFMDEADVRGDEQNRMDPQLMANAMLDIIPKDTGLFRNVVPQAAEDLVKNLQRHTWNTTITPHA